MVNVSKTEVHTYSKNLLVVNRYTDKVFVEKKNHYFVKCSINNNPSSPPPKKKKAENQNIPTLYW